MRANITTVGELPVTEQIFNGLKTALYDAVENKLGYPVEIVLAVSPRGVQIETKGTRYYPWSQATS